MIFNQLYCKESDGEKGTLKQLQTAINRTNIPTKVKDDPMAVEDFMDLTLDAHVVAAAMGFFGMTSVTSTPTTNVDIDTIKHLSKEEQWRSQGGARGARAPPLAPGSVYIYVELTFRNV